VINRTIAHGIAVVALRIVGHGRRDARVVRVEDKCMTTATQTPETTAPAATARANALAERLIHGAHALAALAAGLSDAQWQTRIPKDGRTIGVVVHHVASIYPLEIELAQQLAAGKPIAGVTWNDVHALNAKHAADNAAIDQRTAVDLLLTNSAAAAAAIRALSDEDLDRAAGISLNDDAPLTCQFMLEDHAVRHSFHHLATIQAALRG
jgi:hypothetical protein